MNKNKYVLDNKKIRAVEAKYAAAHNGNCYDLMLKAGDALFSEVYKRVKQDSHVVIFAGKGNNGGDGYVLAKLLYEQGIPCTVFAIEAPHVGSEADIAYRALAQHGIKVHYDLQEQSCGFDQALYNDQDLIVVDALLGTGMQGIPRSPYDDYISYINRLKAFVIAVDIPSGLNSDTGIAEGDCVNADLVVTMIAYKPGLLTAEASDYIQEIVVKDLGVDAREIWNEGFKDHHHIYCGMLKQNYEDIINFLPHRQRSGHKGDSGKVLLIGGAVGTAGAIMLSGMGALRTGSGLVKIATDRQNFTAINALMPELMTVNAYDIESLKAALEFADVVAVGPGLGLDNLAYDILNIIYEVVGSSDTAVIYDADALNLIASGGVQVVKNSVMTPHEGEAARLLEQSVEEVRLNRIEASVNLQKSYGGVILLKGAGSIVYDGRCCNIIAEGSEAMSTGGMGDLLTGMIASLIGQGLSSSDASLVAACIHGRAGMQAGLDQGIKGTLPSDLLTYIRRLVNVRA